MSDSNSHGRRLSQRTLKMTQLAILIAVMLIFAFTPIGYLKIGIIEITFMTIPVGIGAVLLGPAAGAILGGVFGLTSFIQCFGMSQFGAALLSVDPFFTFILCMIPRILMGLLCGLLYKIFRGKPYNIRAVGCAVTNLAGPMMNTVFFVGSFILLFTSNGIVNQYMDMMGKSSLIAFAAAFVGLNGIIEAVVSFIAGTAICLALENFLHKGTHNDA